MFKWCLEISGFVLHIPDPLKEDESSAHVWLLFLSLTIWIISFVIGQKCDYIYIFEGRNVKSDPGILADIKGYGKTELPILTTSIISLLYIVFCMLAAIFIWKNLHQFLLRRVLFINGVINPYSICFSYQLSTHVGLFVEVLETAKLYTSLLLILWQKLMFYSGGSSNVLENSSIWANEILKMFICISAANKCEFTRI